MTARAIPVTDAMSTRSVGPGPTARPLGGLLSAWLGPLASAMAPGTPLSSGNGLLLTVHQMKAVCCLPAGGLTMREFAHVLGVSAGTATALADRLVRSGAAERLAESDDRRVVRLVPTAAGRSTARAHQVAQDAAVAGLLAAMPTPSHAALVSALDYLASALGAGTVPVNSRQLNSHPAQLAGAVQTLSRGGEHDESFRRHGHSAGLPSLDVRP